MLKRTINIIDSFLILTFITTVHANPAQVLAAKGLGCGEGFGPLAEFFCKPEAKNPAAVGEKLNAVISSIIGFLTVMASIWFIFQFIIAGYQWLNSGGDKNNTQAAQDKITNSLIGLIIVVMAWVIIGVIGKVIGLDILDPGKAIQSLVL